VILRLRPGQRRSGRYGNTVIGDLGEIGGLGLMCISQAARQTQVVRYMPGCLAEGGLRICIFRKYRLNLARETAAKIVGRRIFGVESARVVVGLATDN
jgi:hypothetical protein